MAIDDFSITANSSATPTPSITAGSLTPAGSFSTVQGTASAAKTYTLSGSNLTANLTVGPLAGYEFSTDGFATAGAASLSLTPSSGTVASTTVSVRLAAATTAGTYNGTIDNASTGAATRSITVMGTVTVPPTVTTTAPATGITTTAATIAGNISSLGTPTASTSYGFVYSTTASTAATLVLGGGGVTTAQVGTTGAATGAYSTGLTSLTASTTYYYRAYASNSAGTGYGTVESFTTDAAPTTPLLIATPTALTGFSYYVGAGPSASQSFSLTGSNLTAGSAISIDATGTDYEVSTDNSTFGAMAAITNAAGGTLASTPVYVRLKAGLAAASYASETVSITGGGTASAITVTVSGSVTALPTITTGTVTPNPATQGGSVTVPYATTGTFGPGNAFTAELSSATGTFPGTVLTTTASAAGSLTVTIPGGTAIGSAYAIRVNASNPAVNGTPSGAFAVTTAPCLADNFDTFPLTKWTVNGVTQSTTNRSGTSGGSAAFSGANHSLTSASALSYPNSLDFFVSRSSTTTTRSLQVQVSIDGGSNYSTLATYAIADLTTTLVRKTIDLSAYQTRPSVLLRFLRSSESTTAQIYLEDVAVTCGSAPTLATEPTSQPTLSTANVVFSQADVTVNGGDGSKQLVVIHATSAAAVAPVDGNTYAASTAFGSGATTGTGNYVVYAGPTGTGPNTFTVTGLSATTSYTLETYAYSDNATPGLENYLTTAPGTASFTTTAPPSVFYAKATGDLNMASTFAANSDGSGGSPGDFTAAGITYNVSGANRTISANWTVSGTNSKVVLNANASLVIPATFTFTGKLDQLANSTLIIQNTATAAYTSINQGVQDASSTIDFAQTGSFTVPASSVFAYQNLKLTNGTKTLTRNTGTITSPITSTVVPGNLTLDNTVLGGNGSSPFSSIDLSGNLTLQNGATFNTSSSSRITLNLFGATPQTLTGNGNNILLFALYTYTPGGGAILSDAGGTTTLELGNTAAGGYYLETGTTLALNSNTLRFYSGGKAVIYTGNTSSNGRGTITVSPTSTISLETTSNYSIGTLRLTPGATTVKDLRLQAVNDYLTVPSDLTVNGVLTLANGDLVVGDGVTPATLTLNGTVVNAGSGDIAGSAITNLVVGGTGALGTLIFASGLAEVNNFTLNRTGTGTLTLGSPLTVDGALTLTSGIITTSSTNVLGLATTGTLTAPAFNGTGGSSYVKGPFLRRIATVSSPASFVFPIGKGAAYRPLTLNISAQTGTTTYTAEQFETAPPTSSLGASGLSRVSGVRYFTISPDAQPTAFNGTLTIPFGVDDYANVPAELVVAKRPNASSDWVNIGGSGTSNGSGAGNGAGGSSVAGLLVSGSFTSFSDFALATTNAVPNINPLAAGTVPLPVQLTAFSAQRQADKTVAVKWATATEKNSARFEAQRSLDGREFATVATVAAQGNSMSPTTYTAFDKAAPVAKLYYRLRQVDLDGTTAFSPVVTVAGSGEIAKVELYPNPAHSRISFIAEAATPYRVLNQLGQALLRGTTEAGTASIGIETLPAGLYLLELQTATGRTVQKFEKE
ncbi:T9SS type A sorting domain-containing protein [Hymenobacter negativus]|uniref:T9SS type A sorting domain-containing protein n=1 Tax=Hymenobacter negativus TaxID=2795026 RepID=A0ABS0Q860_9BACT|nr:T9SS type A sorting domain-containing protein [Hymenobacter negativus]MBH8558868.1 T9SS type A sorting domain-containing protein [Hymenobacter negativus]